MERAFFVLLKGGSGNGSGTLEFACTGDIIINDERVFD
jgi:hypothetical protein